MARSLSRTLTFALLVGSRSLRLQQTRRAALIQTAAACALSVSPVSAAEELLEEATFSAGDARFQQKTFDELKYAGVKRSEVGTLGGLPAIKVTYNANKFSYKRMVGTFWRSCDPTKSNQFGSGAQTIIWVRNDEERRSAEESRRRLQLSTEYRSPTFGPMYQGRPVLTEIKTLAGEWERGPEADQDWYLNDPKAYEQARKKTGRTKWFEDAFKPVTVTACQKQSSDSGEGGGTVCGFVYFPCNDENGCKAVTSGSF